MLITLFLIVLGFIFLIKGADFLVDGGSSIAKKFNIPEIVIGMTIVSIGTSMPELMVSVSSAISGHSDMSIGNVIGSNLINLIFILGICAMIKGLPYKKQTKWIESGIAIFSTALLLFFANNSRDNLITKNEGFILIFMCILFVIYNVIMAKRGEVEGKNIERENTNNISIMKSILLIVSGCILLKFGGDFVVDNAVVIATSIGISEKLISLTIIAMGTSLPELVTSIMATKKGDIDMAIGNIIGSGVFNIFLIVGISAILNPISYSTNYNKDLILLLASTIVFAIFPFVGKKDTMEKIEGVLFVTMYTIYLSSTIYFAR